MKPITRPLDRRQRGFALIVTIVLVAFLVLILVGLATFTRVETQVADNSQQIAKARQNALMALNLAVGQLQKHSGPDQRVTATADLQPLAAVNSTSDPISGESLNSGTTDNILDEIDDYWADSRNRRWVGVWRDPDPTRSYVNPMEPWKTVPTPQLLAWLVSGNETTGNAILPQIQVAGFTVATATASDAAIRSFGTAARPYRLLVGAKTTGLTDTSPATELDRAVLAPEEKITSTSVPGLVIDPANPPIVGHYAWWVGDEGVKARANFIDPYAGSTDDREERLRLQSAQRVGIEAMTDLSLYPINDPDLKSVLQPSQLPFAASAANAAAVKTGVEHRYHDITVHSRGVLSDVRNGGLKADLSWMLSSTTNAPLRNDLRSLYNDNTITASDSIIGKRVFSPYSQNPGTAPFTTGGSYGLGLSRATTWTQLKSFFNMGNLPGVPNPGVINSAGNAEARAADLLTQGINPLIVQAKLFYELSIDASGDISLKVRPLVVLANPYDITLTGDYWVRFGRPAVYVYAGTFDAANPAPTEPNLTKFNRISSGFGLAETDPNPNDTNNNYNNRPQLADSIPYLDRITLAIRDTSIPPGEARVYCLDSNQSHSGGSAYEEMEMQDGYDESPSITVPSSLNMGTYTHAGLYITSGNLDVRLFTIAPPADPTSTAVNELAQYIYGRPLEVAGEGMRFFVVYTTATGTSNAGGGTWMTFNDAQSSAIQQANFLQYNLRAQSSFWTANSNDDHPVENTISAMRNGALGNDDYFTADLMFEDPPATGDRVRWGSVNKAKPGNPLSGEPKAGVDADTGFSNILYSIPRPGHPISSIAQLQHLGSSGYLVNDVVSGGTTTELFAIQANTFQLNYPIGNSYPNPRVPRSRPWYTGTSAIGSTNMGTAYDSSWLFNDVLADRFYFSSIHATAALDFDSATNRIINHRLRPFRPVSEVPHTLAADVATHYRGTPRTAATNLLLDGAFNINSTSPEAWKAVLSSLRDTPVLLADGTTSVPADNAFSRTLHPTSGYTSGSTGTPTGRNGNSKEAWSGFHNLADAEIAALADEIVLQIRRRGPFLSFADFMNRRLVESGNDPMGRGLSGAVQSAIDAILNKASDVDTVFQHQSNIINLAESAFRARTLVAGSPGYLLQADLLSPLAANLAARSDTFVVRSYGDVQNPVTGEITGRAWCEAVVQRTPDYVVPKPASGSGPTGANDPAEIPAAGTDNDKFGRRYQIVSFRWLSADDI